MLTIKLWQSKEPLKVVQFIQSYSAAKWDVVWSISKEFSRQIFTAKDGKTRVIINYVT